MFEFLTDECVSDHNERIRSIQGVGNYWKIMTRPESLKNYSRFQLRWFSGRAKTVPVPLCGESITCRLSAHVDVRVQVIGVIHGNNFT